MDVVLADELAVRMDVVLAVVMVAPSVAWTVAPWDVSMVALKVVLSDGAKVVKWVAGTAERLELMAYWLVEWTVGEMEWQ